MGESETKIMTTITWFHSPSCLVSSRATWARRCVEKLPFFGSVQKYYYPGLQGQGDPGVLCRAIFGVREEILIFGEIYTSEWGVTSKV